MSQADLSDEALRAALPTRRVEAWKYSDLRAALRDVPLPSSAARGQGSVIAQLAPPAEIVRVAPAQALVRVERLDGQGLDARASEIDVESGGAFTRVVIQTGGGVPLSAARVRLAEGATFRQFALLLGARLARVETDIRVEGAGASVELGGLYMVGAGRHADLTSRIDHVAPGSTADQRIRGAARAGGRGVFQGKIVVHEGAQRTDARQSHRALMLADGAEIDAKPELEIYADDVQCAHGNTIGALDETALFYLRQRGIPFEQARAMLIEAFLAEAIPAWLDDTVRSEIEAHMRAWLGEAA